MTNPDQAAAAVDPLVGQVIAGRYRLLERIGKGGMGAVYEAEHEITKKRCAIKTLLPGLGRIDEIKRRFEREARAASLLDHPNVVSVSDFGALADGSLFLAMELVRGRSLGDVIDEGGLPLERALDVARQVLDALGHAHRHGVIHRDLKPDNVMLLDARARDSDDAGDVVKLFDFGIAKVVGDAEAEVGGEKLTQAGIAFGTPDYMAPEQALGEVVDARADVYSMGVILFELLACRKPFVNADKMAVLRMQVAVPPPSLAEAAGRPFPHVLEAVVARALAKRREERFASAAAMLAALDDAVDQMSQPAHPVTAGVAAAVATPDSGPSQTNFPTDSSPNSSTEGGAMTTGWLSVDAAATPLATAARPPALLSTGMLSDLARSRPFLLRVAILGLPALTLLIVLIVLVAGGGNDGRSGSQPSASAVPLGIDPTGSSGAPSDLSRRAEERLTAGDVAGAVAILEAGLDGDGSRDAHAHLILGHARARMSRDVEALAAYERAVALAPRLSGDEAMRRHVVAMLARKDKTIPVAAIDFLCDRVGAPARATIVDVASGGKVKEVRQRARAFAEKRGWLGDVDLLTSYGLDLQQGASCAERRAAVPKLRALKNKKAIPLLKKARGRTGGGLFGTGHVNGCLDTDAREAIEFLEAMP